MTSEADEIQDRSPSWLLIHWMLSAAIGLTFDFVQLHRETVEREKRERVRLEQEGVEMLNRMKERVQNGNASQVEVILFGLDPDEYKSDQESITKLNGKIASGDPQGKKPD